MPRLSENERNRPIGMLIGGLNQTKHCSNVWLQCIDSNAPRTTRPPNRERKRPSEARTTTSACHHSTSGPADDGESYTGQD